MRFFSVFPHHIFRIDGQRFTQLMASGKLHKFIHSPHNCSFDFQIYNCHFFRLRYDVIIALAFLINIHFLSILLSFIIHLIRLISPGDLFSFPQRTNLAIRKITRTKFCAHNYCSRKKYPSIKDEIIADKLQMKHCLQKLCP